MIRDGEGAKSGGGVKVEGSRVGKIEVKHPSLPPIVTRLQILCCRPQDHPEFRDAHFGLETAIIPSSFPQKPKHLPDWTFSSKPQRIFSLSTYRSPFLCQFLLLPLVTPTASETRRLRASLPYLQDAVPLSPAASMDLDNFLDLTSGDDLPPLGYNADGDVILPNLAIDMSAGYVAASDPSTLPVTPVTLIDLTTAHPVEIIGLCSSPSILVILSVFLFLSFYSSISSLSYFSSYNSLSHFFTPCSP